jgi:hypothetical protein
LITGPLAARPDRYARPITGWLGDRGPERVAVMERISRRLVSWGSAAYKDIDVVMKDADDLVQVCHVLRQIVNVKGD